MAPAAAMSLLMPPEVADFGDFSAYAFIAQVVVEDGGSPMLFMPVLRKSNDAPQMVIDFGDGEKWEVDGDLEATVDTSVTPHVLSGVAYHTYQSPGTYFLTMKGVSAFCGGRVVESTSSLTYLYKEMPQIRNIYWCTLECRFSTHRYRSAQFSGFTDVDLFFTRGNEPFCGFAVHSPRRIYQMRAYSGGILNDIYARESADYLSGGVEEIYAPSAIYFYNTTPGSSLWMPDNVFDKCESLRLFCAPKMTCLNSPHIFSSVPDRIDVYVGHLVGTSRFVAIHGSAFSDSNTGDGANIYMHVDMTGSEFRALDGWVSGADAHPWGANYLRVYATDGTFDCRDIAFSPDGVEHPYDPDTGLWVDENGRWIDHDGNYVMPDGATPAVWIDGDYYKADAQGRRVDDDGHFLDQYGNVVSDCGRPATSDGFFVTYTKDERDNFLSGNVVDFYGQTLYERYDLADGWFEDHPEYSVFVSYIDKRGGNGYWCYRIPEVMEGSTVEVWHFYDSSRHLVFKHYPAPPDGRLESALVNPGVLIPIGYSPSDGAGMQFRLKGRVYGDYLDRYTDQYASNLEELALRFTDPSTSGLPANFGLIVSVVDDYPSDRTPVYGNAYESLLEYPSSSSFPVTGWGNAVFEAADTGTRYRWTGSQYEEAEEGDTDPRVIDTHAIVGYTSSPSVSRVYRLAYGHVQDAVTGEYGPYAVVQVSGSLLAIPCSFGAARDGDPSSDFDITFGNLHITDNVTGETASGTEVDPPEGGEGGTGWTQLRIGSNDSWPVSFWFKELEVSVAGPASGSRVVLARFRPWLENGAVRLKDVVSGNFISPTAGVMTPGEYYTT